MKSLNKRASASAPFGTTVLLPLERQIALRDEAGIDRTILFTTTVHPEQAADLEALHAELAKLSEILGGYILYNAGGAMNGMQGVAQGHC